MNVIVSIKDYLTIVQYLSIIGLCSYSTILSIKWFIEVRRKYTPIVICVKVFHGIISILWLGIYLYSLIRIILGDPIDVNPYGITIVRPMIVITSLYFAISAKVRYYIAKHREDPCPKER
jgi:hypothetical protein